MPGISTDNTVLGIYQDDTSGVFNQQLIDSININASGNAVKLSFIIYENSKFFSSSAADVSELLDCSAKQKVSDKVVSMSPIPGLVSGENLVQIKFKENEFEKNCSISKNKNMRRNITYECVFWEEAKRNWNNYGCTHRKNVTNGITSHFCHCNHTTNFAMLMVRNFFLGFSQLISF
jgi:hypothetical protein